MDCSFTVDNKRSWAAPPLCRRYLAASLETITARVLDGPRLRDTPIQWAIGHLDDHESEVLGVWAGPDAAVARRGLRATTPSSAPAALMPGGPTWRTVFAELRARGVEQMRFVIGGDVPGLRRDLQTLFPAATALASPARLVERAVSQVTVRHRAAVEEGLYDLLRAGSASEAQAGLARLDAGGWGARYPVLAAEWRLAFEQGWALLSLPPALWREVLLADGEAAAVSRGLRRAIGRHGGFADAAAAASFVAAALARAVRRLDRIQARAAQHNDLCADPGSGITAVGA